VRRSEQRAASGEQGGAGHSVKEPLGQKLLLAVRCSLPASSCYPPAANFQETHRMNVKKRLLDGARMNRAIRRMAI